MRKLIPYYHILSQFNQLKKDWLPFGRYVLLCICVFAYSNIASYEENGFDHFQNNRSLLYLLHVIASFLTSLFYYILCFLAAFQHKMLCIYFFIIFPQFGLMEYNNGGGRHAENGIFQHFFTILPNAPIGILTKVEFNRVIQIAAQTQSLPNFTGHF